MPLDQADTVKPFFHSVSNNRKFVPLFHLTYLCLVLPLVVIRNCPLGIRVKPAWQDRGVFFFFTLTFFLLHFFLLHLIGSDPAYLA